MKRTVNVLALTLLGLLLTACSIPVQQEKEPERETGSAGTHEEPTTKPMSAAAVHLSNEAMQARDSEDYEKAVDLLERAIRIEPANPLLWHQVASIRFEQGRFPEAIEFANRSMALIRGNANLMELNRSLIESAESRL